MKRIVGTLLPFLIMFLHQPAAAQTLRLQEIDNGLLRISFDKTTRTFSLYENVADEWVTVFHNATTSLTLKAPEVVMLSLQGGELTGKVEKYIDAAGAGKMLNIHIGTPQAEWSLSFVLYDAKKIGTIQASVRNTSGRPWQTDELRLLELKDAGYLQLATDNVLLHVNGYQSWSGSEVTRLDSSHEHTSYWSTLFFEPEAFRSVLFGFITNRVSTNFFRLQPLTPGENALRFTTVSDVKTLDLRAGGELQCDRLAFSFDASPLNNLERYGDYLQAFAPQVNKPFTPAGKGRVAQPDKKEVPTGWCSWYYYYDRVTEDNVVQNLNFAAKHFKNSGMKYIQIDDGYQLGAGDWDTNSKFPHGHQWLVRQIHGKNLFAGLWVAPFAVAESSTVVREHPEWLLRDDQGSLKVFLTNKSWGGKIYGLDPGIPSVQSWLENLFYTITSYWGYDYVKIDFLHIGNEGGRYDKGVTSARAYQLGLDAIRRGVGSDKFILGCGAPIGSSVGYVDGMRIGNDVDAHWEGVTAAVNAASQRYFLHNTVWYDDPDCLVVRDPLTLDQARMWAAVVALSGQMNMMSDNLAALQPERIDLLKMTLPSYGKSGAPLDLFSSPKQEGLTLVALDGKSSLKLPDQWKFSAGDSASWNEVNYDDGSWNEIRIPGQWEKQGYRELDGVAWYRVTFSLPAGWSRGPVKFYFGAIDDCDQTFLNGTLIGETGSFPPEFKSGWTSFRVYELPEHVINWEGENILAARVYDGGGAGGVTGISQLNLPAVWNLVVDKNFDKWNVVGIFNWSHTSSSISVTPVQLGLQPKKSYVACELWHGEYLGEMNNGMKIQLAPTSSKILSVHEKLKHPFVLSTSRHVTQGAVDLFGEQWEDFKRILSVVSDNLIDGSYSVMVYVPEDYAFQKVIAPVGYDIDHVGTSIVKITFHIWGKSKIAWKAIFQ